MISRWLVKLARRLCRHYTYTHYEITHTDGRVVRRRLVCNDCGEELVDTVVLPPDCGKSLPPEVAKIRHDVEVLYRAWHEFWLNTAEDGRPAKAPTSESP